MAVLLQKYPASGGPGIEPRWTRSDKDGVGTAYSALSRVWFTVSKGILNEVYYPTIDRPQIRDLQYLITDGETFFRDERRMDEHPRVPGPGRAGLSHHQCRSRGALPHHQGNHHRSASACVLIHTRLEAEADMLAKLRLFALLAPHLEVGGRGNNGNVVQTNWGKVLTAHKGGYLARAGGLGPVLAMLLRLRGTTDGWQDLARQLPDGLGIRLCAGWQHRPDRGTRYPAEPGIRAGAGLRRQPPSRPGHGGPGPGHFLRRSPRPLHRAVAARLPSLAAGEGKGDGRRRRLYHVSHSMILAHEDKTYDGALIASLSIPWGEYTSDDELGGYHLVWTRDMCHSASGLLAAGSTEVPLRALIYLACTQKEDGGFYQNFWINGEPHWRGIQLDETAFPILLAWRLHQAEALQDFDPYPMVLKAAGYLIHHGPVTPQERWEENSGYSPSTLAVHIAALICAAAFARERGQQATAQYLEEYADFLESHLEPWTVTTEGTLVPGIPPPLHPHSSRRCQRSPAR